MCTPSAPSLRRAHLFFGSVHAVHSPTTTTRDSFLSLFGTRSNLAFGCLDDLTQEVAHDEGPEITEGQDSLSVPYGSYHQLYRIDGKLVAVGVVDILPKCLVSFWVFFSLTRKKC